MNSKPKLFGLDQGVIIASFIGIFIAGFLSYTTAKGLLPPCGASGSEPSGCAIVEQSSYSKWFNIPVAYFGLLGYLSILGVAIMRFFASGKKHTTLLKIGSAMTGFGVLASLFLTFVALSELKTACVWCLASGVTMFILLFLHIFQLGTVPPEQPQGLPIPVVGVGALLAIVLFGAFVGAATEDKGLKVKFEDTSLKALLPVSSKVVHPEAKVFLIEYADPNCPTCRRNYNEVKNIVGRKQGKLGYAFVCFPLFTLPGHETSAVASLIAEYAATKGKYHEFLDIIFEEANTERTKSLDGLIAMAGEAGLDKQAVDDFVRADLDSDRGKLKKELTDKMTEGFNKARKIGITSTPTFVICADGQQPSAHLFTQIEDVLNRDPWAPLLK